MNREILFRGKRVDNGEWIYGDLFHRNDELLINNYLQGFNLAIIPSTVGQYTGLTDKNGKKIFEGGIFYLLEILMTTMALLNGTKKIQVLQYHLAVYLKGLKNLFSLIK